MVIRSSVYGSVRLSLSLLLVLVVVAGIVLSAGSSYFSLDAAYDSDIIKGEEIQFAVSPRWVTSGTWSRSGSELVLVDAVKKSLIVYDRDGNLVKSMEDNIEHPVLAHGSNGKYFWVEDEDGQLLLLDSSFKTARKLDLRASVRSPAGSLTAVFGWVPIDMTSFLVFGDLTRTGKATVSAILRVPLNAPESFKVLRVIPVETVSRRLFLVGRSYVASVGGIPFYMIAGEGPEVFTDNFGFRLVESSGQVIENIAPPQLPAKVPMSSTASLFSMLEKSSYPAGIYSNDDNLFILRRTRSGSGLLTWYLIKIDPLNFSVIWRRAVDTSAKHLTVIPGRRYWAFVEKGSVRGPGDQSIDSFLRVPAEVFE